MNSCFKWFFITRSCVKSLLKQRYGTDVRSIVSWLSVRLYVRVGRSQPAVLVLLLPSRVDHLRLPLHGFPKHRYSLSFSHEYSVCKIVFKLGWVCTENSFYKPERQRIMMCLVQNKRTHARPGSRSVALFTRPAFFGTGGWLTCTG